MSCTRDLELDADRTYRVRMSGRALMTLADNLQMCIASDTEEARKQQHPDDAAGYYAALADLNSAMAAMLQAEEED